MHFRNTWASRQIVFGATLLLLATIACADEEKADINQLPKAVANAVTNRFPGAQLSSATKESDNGQIVYDIELKHDGTKYEMDIKSDGTILEIEKQIDAKGLPAAVAAAVKSKYPDSTVKEVMEVNKVTGTIETLDHYEVTIVKADKKLLEVVASLDGKTVKEEE